MVWQSLRRIFTGTASAPTAQASTPAAEPPAAAQTPPARPGCTNCGAVAAPYHVTERNPNLEWVALHFCPPCAEHHVNQVGPVSPPVSFQHVPPPGMVPVTVLRVVISELHEQQIVVLGEPGGVRNIPIVIGIFEATSLDRRLQRLPSPRPLTHDGWLATIGTLGAKVRYAGINALRDHVYLAFLRLEHGGKPVEVDLRPSDAFVMAHIADVPFYVPSDMLAALWQETIDPRGWGSPAPAERPTGIQEGWV
jgi:uncharacterized protein